MKIYHEHHIHQYNESKYKSSFRRRNRDHIYYSQKHPSQLNERLVYLIQVFQSTSVYNIEQICHLMLKHDVKIEQAVHVLLFRQFQYLLLSNQKKNTNEIINRDIFFLVSKKQHLLLRKLLISA